MYTYIRIYCVCIYMTTDKNLEKLMTLLIKKKKLEKRKNEHRFYNLHILNERAFPPWPLKIVEISRFDQLTHGDRFPSSRYSFRLTCISNIISCVRRRYENVVLENKTDFFFLPLFRIEEETFFSRPPQLISVLCDFTLLTIGVYV